MCPVCALKFYVDRTKDPVFRRGRKRLFVSIVEMFEQDIRLAPVARWIVSTIQLAYSLTTTSPDLRHQASVTLGDMLEAATWSNHSTFSQFYLRDRSVLADGMLSIGPVVTAQHVVSEWSPFFRVFPSIRPFLFSLWWPHFSPLEIEGGPWSVFPDHLVSPVPLPMPGEVPSSCPAWLPREVTCREYSPYFGSLVTLHREDSPANITVVFHSTTRWLVAPRIE
jgi:hypothetical protein